MNKNSLAFFIALVSFILLFYKQSLGINVGIFVIINAISIVLLNPGIWNRTLNYVAFWGFLLSGISFSMNGGTWALTVTVFSYFLMFAVVAVPQIQALHLSVLKIIPSYVQAWQDFYHLHKGNNKLGLGQSRFRAVLRVTVLPVIILFGFMVLYSLGSSYFSSMFGSFFSWIDILLQKLMHVVSPAFFWTFVAGVLFSVIMMLRQREKHMNSEMNNHADNLYRIRSTGRNFKMMDLKYEYKSAIFLFGMLNIMLAIFIYLDITNIWFGFSWEGEFLKDMVHMGTYVLIFSVLLSIAVTIYYFRSNLNYYPNKNLLLIIVQLWIFLNVLLVVCVLIRNALYIEHFALAYKRIGVYFFLALTIIGLYTIWQKVNQRKSLYFVLRINALSAFVIVVLSITVNWDRFIGQYNLSHYETAFIHLDYLVGLEDEALPFLQLSAERITEIEDAQVKSIPFANKGYFQKISYKEIIDQRVLDFRDDYENKSWLSKTGAEIRAFRELD